MSIFVLHCFGYHREFTRFLSAKTKRVRRFLCYVFSDINVFGVTRHYAWRAVSSNAIISEGCGISDSHGLQMPYMLQAIRRSPDYLYVKSYQYKQHIPQNSVLRFEESILHYVGNC